MIVLHTVSGWMSSLCFGSQHCTEADWMGEFEVTVYYVMWWLVLFEGHRQGRIKGCHLQRVVRVWVCFDGCITEYRIVARSSSLYLYWRVVKVSQERGVVRINIYPVRCLKRKQVVGYCTGWYKKTGTFEKPIKNWRNPRKKILTEIEPLQPAF